MRLLLLAMMILSSVVAEQQNRTTTNQTKIEPAGRQCKDPRGAVETDQAYTSINETCPAMKGAINKCCDEANGCIKQHTDKNGCNRFQQQCLDDLLGQERMELCFDVAIGFVDWKEVAYAIPESIQARYGDHLANLRSECRMTTDAIDRHTSVFATCISTESFAKAKKRDCDKTFKKSLAKEIGKSERCSKCHYALGYFEAVLDNTPIRKEDTPETYDFFSREQQREHWIRNVFIYFAVATIIFAVLLIISFCCNLRNKKEETSVYSEEVCSRRSSAKSHSRRGETTETATNSTGFTSPISVSDSSMD